MAVPGQLGVMNETRENRGTDRTATGHAGQDSAKFGFERRGGEGDWAQQAQLENNTPVVPELLEGRCSIDGLPAGNCVHFPGPQLVTDPVTGEAVYEEGYGATEEKAAREKRGTQPPRR